MTEFQDYWGSDVDAFAGPGGLDLGAREVGLDPIGIEIDPTCCETREAAGLLTVQGDAAAIDLAEWEEINGRPRVFMASAPCQPWSAAGKREAERDREAVYRRATAFARGDFPAQEDWTDERSKLAAEPMRWIKALRPRFVCLEQVPPVLGLWEFCADLLHRQGYSTWYGLLSAEQYGIPQTRVRAFLLAVDRESGQWSVSPPVPTHQRFIPRQKAKQEETLFEPPEAQRIIHPEDVGLLPWISMAEALGWGMTERPYPVVASGRSTGGPDKEKVGGSEAREAIYREMREGRWKLIGNAQSRATERNGYEPAPTIKGGKDFGERRWVHERPSTTVAGDPRIPAPGHKKDAEFPDAPRRMEESISVEIHEAAVLQGFPADYPFKGSKTKKFEQVGNAVPPGFAAAVLGSLLAEQIEGPAQMRTVEAETMEGTR